MTSVTSLAKRLQEDTAFQRLPEPILWTDYEKMIQRGIETLFIDTGRSDIFKDEMFIAEQNPTVEDVRAMMSTLETYVSAAESAEEEFVELPADIFELPTNKDLMFDYDMNIAEKKYVLICAQITFYKRVQADVNNITSYSTDALTVTGGDKPYAHLADTIDKLENERRIVFYKLDKFRLVDDY